MLAFLVGEAAHPSRGGIAWIAVLTVVTLSILAFPVYWCGPIAVRKVRTSMNALRRRAVFAFTGSA
jgi:hypothetical protein